MKPVRAPRSCPACGDRLHVSELACEECATRVSGSFPTCEFCGLDDEQRGMLRVFLASRGNMKELERHLGVSYPTARARFSELLATLGMAEEAVDPRLALLEAVARGEVTVDAALADMEQP